MARAERPTGIKRFEKISRRAEWLAKTMGIPELAQDIAQEVVLGFVENPEKRQSVRNAVIDAIRANFGNSNSLPGQLKQKERYGIQVEQGAEDPVKNDFDLLGKTNPQDRAMYILKYKWGLSGVEIGQVFGVSGSRVSQRITNMQNKIKKYVVEK
jgi:DNA-directed RNA polymerase specialized sigma24 family protein